MSRVCSEELAESIDVDVDVDVDVDLVVDDDVPPAPRPSGVTQVVDFRVLYEENVAFVWRNLRRLGVFASDLEDRTQEVFLVAFRRIDSPVEAMLIGRVSAKPCCFLFLLADGLSRRGALRGDAFALGAVLLVTASTLLFVFYPVLCVLSSAVRDIPLRSIPS